MRVNGARVMRRVMKGSAVSVNIRGLDTAYVRFVVYGYGSQMAWTQPFFREGLDGEDATQRK